jgi:ubiquinone biosynthesis protein UbiJ
MIPEGFVIFLNHVLDQHDWARERLKAHAGRSVELRSPPAPALRITIDDSGRVAAAAPDTRAELVATAKPGALALLARRDPGALKEVDFAGPADLAETVQHLLVHLRWDLEEDLSLVFGDVLAHRMAAASRDFLTWQAEAGERLARNFAEYWTEEQPLLARRADVERFKRELEVLREDLERLEQRIESAARAAASKAPH